MLVLSSAPSFNPRRSRRFRWRLGARPTATSGGWWSALRPRSTPRATSAPMPRSRSARPPSFRVHRPTPTLSLSLGDGLLPIEVWAPLKYWAIQLHPMAGSCFCLSFWSHSSSLSAVHTVSVKFTSGRRWDPLRHGELGIIDSGMIIRGYWFAATYCPVQQASVALVAKVLIIRGYLFAAT